MHDMHCHLDFMANGEQVANDARQESTVLFANTVTPRGWRTARQRFSAFDNVTVGFGMHPWWVRQDAEGASREGALGDAAVLEKVLTALAQDNPRFIGEVGLDFSKRHVQTRQLQTRVFAAIAQWAAEQGGALMSIHSVHAAAEVLDVLESTGALESCTCIFHWYSGPSDQLKRAIQAGCYFSVGPRMTATGKGREYAKAIPVKRLLLETDAPPQQGQAYSYAELRAQLGMAADAIVAAKDGEVLAQLDETAHRLLGRS